MKNESGRYSAKNSSTVMPGHITLQRFQKRQQTITNMFSQTGLIE